MQAHRCPPTELAGGVGCPRPVLRFSMSGSPSFPGAPGLMAMDQDPDPRLRFIASPKPPSPSAYPCVRGFAQALLWLLMLGATATTAMAAAPRLGIRPGDRPDLGWLLSLEGDTPGEYRIESSTNLVNWTGLLSSNSLSGRIEIPVAGQAPGESRRFFRGIQQQATAPTATIGFAAPLNRSVLDEARPQVVLETAGFDPARARFFLRANGTNVPARFTVSGSTVRAELDAPLPAGFLTLFAGAEGEGVALKRLARVDVAVRLPGIAVAPRAAPDLALVQTETPTRIGVLANDQALTGDALTLLAGAPPLHGTVRVEGAEMIYVPVPGYAGIDRFGYKITDSAGSSSTGVVRVLVAVPTKTAATAYVVDQPSAENEFRELHEALDWVCSAASGVPGGGRAQIVIRTRRVLGVSTLAVRCPVEVRREGEGNEPVVLGGSAIVINASADLSLVGMHFSAAQVTIQSSANLTVWGTVFDGSATLNLVNPGGAGTLGLRAVGTAAKPSGIGGGQELNLIGFKSENTQVHFDTRLSVQAQVADGEANALGVDGDLVLDSKVSVEHVTSQGFKASLDLGNTSRVSGGSMITADAHEWGVTARGQNQLQLDTVTTARLALDLDGAGRLEAELRNSRSQRLEQSIATGRTTYAGENNTTVDASYRFGGEGISGVAEWRENKLNAAADVAVVNEKNYSLDFELKGSDLLGKASFDASADFKLKIDDGVTVGAGFESVLRNGPADLDISEFTVSGPMKVQGLPEAALTMKVRNSRAKAGLEARAGPGVFVTVDLSETLLGDGGPVNFIVEADLGRQNRTGDRRAGLAGLTSVSGGAGINIRNCTFSPPPPLNGRERAPLQIVGADVPITLLNNRINSRTEAIVITEWEKPVLIGTNTLTGGGIALDGDVETEPGVGLASGLVTVSGNTIVEGSPKAGVRIQDARRVVLERNIIEAERCLDITSASVDLVGNHLNSGGPGRYGIWMGRGGLGMPAAVTARENTFKGFNPVFVLPGAHLMAISNSIVPSGSVALPPIPPIPPIQIPGLGGGFDFGGGDGDGDGDGGDGDGGDIEYDAAISIGPNATDCAVYLRGNRFPGTEISYLGGGYLEVSDNVFDGPSGISLGQPFFAGMLRADIIGNRFLGGDHRVATASGVLLELARNHFATGCRVDLAGFNQSVFATVSGNQFGTGQVSVSAGAYTRLTGNSFDEDSSINDDGFLLQSPGANGINPELITSPIDFDGEGCADFPPPQRDPDTGECSRKGINLPQGPPVPTVTPPPWPVF